MSRSEPRCCHPVIQWYEGDGLKEYLKLCPLILVYSGIKNDIVVVWDKAVQP